MLRIQTSNNTEKFGLENFAYFKVGEYERDEDGEIILFVDFVFSKGLTLTFLSSKYKDVFELDEVVRHCIKDENETLFFEEQLIRASDTFARPWSR